MKSTRYYSDKQETFVAKKLGEGNKLIVVQPHFIRVMLLWKMF